MKKIAVIFLFIFVLLLHQNAFTLEVRKDRSGRDLYASDRFKIKLDTEASMKINTLIENNERIDQTGLETLDALNNEHGVTKIVLAHRPVNDKVWEQQTGFNRWYIVFVSERTDIEHAISQYKNNEYVEFANPEFIKYISLTPNDLYFDDCWGHDNTATNGPGSGHIVGFDSHIEEAWDDEQGYGVSSVIIAILDTGTDYNHVDLNDNCVSGWDYGDGDSDPMDDSADEGHGTCCAGVAAGEVNNSIGVAGVAGGCSIMPLKISNSAGSLLGTAINNALTHCGDNDVDVASMSFGSYTSQGDDPAGDAAIAYAYDHGVTLLAATANGDGSAIANPANDEHVIAVGAASPCGERKTASSCDAQNWWGSDYGIDDQDNRAAVDIVAPTILPATDVTGSTGYSTGDYIDNFNGTSCATPYAAGVAALILSKNPYLTPAQVRTALISTATDVIDEETTPGWDMYTGYGLVNADAAVGSVAGSGFPLCYITNPSNNEAIEKGTIVTITVDASDPSRSVSSVKIYIDGFIKTTDFTAPYEYVWDTASESIDYHDIKATATDDGFNETDHIITVRVANPTTNIFEDDFETNKGWSLSGEFERTAPGGLGGNYGNPDPSSAYGGTNVLGVDLTGLGSYPGDYETSLADRAYQAISPSIDCSDYNNVTLSFFRWLNVESPSFDHAYIDIDNGSGWEQIWTNTGGIEDAAWSLQNIDISTYADEQATVQVRFCMGGSDTSWQYSGWNIDDLIISGESTAIPGQGQGDNLGDPTQPAQVDVEPIDIDGSSVDPDVIVDPTGDLGITVNVTVTDAVQGSTPVPNPDSVIISYAVDVIGTIDGVTLEFDLEFTPLTGLDQIYWLSGTNWVIPNSVDWSTPDHVTFDLTLSDRNASTEIILSRDDPLPASLSSFTAIYSNGSPIVNWVTQSESDNIGWNVYRSVSNNFGQAQILNLNTIPGNGTTSEPSFYSFTDEYEVQENSTYWYWLESISGSGETESFGPVSLTITPDGNEIPEIPLETALHQNFPNPFNPSTLISFEIKENETGVLSIYNIKGQLIVKEEFGEGRHSYPWDARDHSSGIYLYKLQAKRYSKIMKMLLVK